MKFWITTFGCAANVADSERITSYYRSLGHKPAKTISNADLVVINSCMIRQMAEDRVYGLVRNLSLDREKGRKVKIIVTGCMTGMALRDKTGEIMAALKKRLPEIDDFQPIEELGINSKPERWDTKHALVLISNGCNNFCTYCVVPFTRGREVSRPIADIISECRDLAMGGYTKITLIGQNVNSYGSDLKKSDSSKVTYVKHLGRLRIPTLFPYLLSEICKIDRIESIDFISSNPWDFSDDLIKVISDNRKISRQIHLPIQSGDARILQKMNRWYTPGQYIQLVSKLRQKIPDVTISTDIIVGFCGETEKQFENTVSLCRTVGFSKAYISMYSDRNMTAAHKTMKDDVPYAEKKRRWKILENLINQKKFSKN